MKVGKGWIVEFSYEDILSATKRTIHDLASKSQYGIHHEKKMEMDIVDTPEIEVKLDSLISLKKLG